MRMLSSLLVILFALSSIGRAQQSQPQKAPVEQKQSTPKANDKQPPSNSPKEADDKQDEKLAVYQVHRLGDRILALRSVRAKAFELARLASVLWKHDEPHARVLFEKALNLTIATRNDRESSVVAASRRRIIALIARSDAE